MKLVTFGDSWIHGDELTPDTPEYRNSVNIGGLIYKDFNFTEYINYANNGASNERIILQLMEYKNSKNYSKDDLIVVGLSSLARNLLYINLKNSPLTLPSWDIMHLNSNDDAFKEKDKDYLDWFEKTGFYITNTRNELVRYALNIFSIKSLLSDNKKYLVWQSLDDLDFLYKTVEMKNWNDITLHWDEKNVNHSTISKIFFDKEYIKKELYSNIEKTQMWINFTEPSWQKYLKSTPDIKTYINKTHPNELGHFLWYDKIIKKYIKTIL